jgi:hypothetical protein
MTVEARVMARESYIKTVANLGEVSARRELRQMIEDIDRAIGDSVSIPFKKDLAKMANFLNQGKGAPKYLQVRATGGSLDRILFYMTADQAEKLEAELQGKCPETFKLKHRLLEVLGGIYRRYA